MENSRFAPSSFLQWQFHLPAVTRPLPETKLYCHAGNQWPTRQGTVYEGSEKNHSWQSWHWSGWKLFCIDTANIRFTQKLYFDSASIQCRPPVQPLCVGALPDRRTVWMFVRHGRKHSVRRIKQKLQGSIGKFSVPMLFQLCERDQLHSIGLPLMTQSPVHKMITHAFCLAR